MKMKHIVIGIRGQIGTCVATFLKGVGEGDIVGVEAGDVVCEGYHYGDDDGSSYVYDMMHVCIPFCSREQFLGAVRFCMSKYVSRYVVVYSTVLPGTCGELGENVVHSPVEGRHPDLIGGFRTFRRFVAGKAYKPIADFYTKCGLKVVTFGDARVSELGKTLSTTRYGISILFAAEQERLCKELGLEFGDVVLEYQRMYNEGYEKLNEKRFIQPLIVPPENGLGGHCVLENAILLDGIVESPLIKQMLSLGKSPAAIHEEKPYLNRAWLYAEYWGKGRSTLDIARQFNVTDANILRIMKDRDIPRRSNKWTKQEISNLMELSQTLTFKEIAEKIGKSHDAVRLKAIQLNIESVYDPSERSEDIRKQISATLQGISIEEWDGFKESVNNLIRKSEQYKEWRTKVFHRDNYTCQSCSSRSGNGESVYLHAHHIKEFAQFPEERFNVENGKTLCDKCHRQLHFG